MLTGEDIIIDETSGLCIAHQKSISDQNPYGVLVTWKADQNILPVGFQVERSETKGGQITTTERKNASSTVVATNLQVLDGTGRPLSTYETITSVTPSSILASPASQYAQFDTDIESGKAYYYRVRAKSKENPTILDFGEPNLSLPILRNLNAFMRTLQDALAGLGDPSTEVSVYVPNEGDATILYDMHQRGLEESGKSGLVAFGGVGGWSRVSLGDIARPLLLLIEELRNFVEAFLDSIQSGASEIVAFIELLQTKINTLNTFIEILQAIILMLEVMGSVSFGCLFTTTDNGTAGVLSAINDDTLPGVPTASDQDYVASVTILGGTSGVGAALNALSVLFGIS